MDGGRTSGNRGAYILAEWQPIASGPWVFARAGVAEPAINRFASYTGAGVSWRGVFAGRANDELSVGIAAGHNGSPYMERERLAGGQPSRTEATLELTYLVALTDVASVQGDIQYVMSPNTDRSRPNAVALTLRTQLSF